MMEVRRAEAILQCESSYYEKGNPVAIMFMKSYLLVYNSLAEALSMQWNLIRYAGVPL